MKRLTKIISGIATLSAISVAWVSPTFAWGPERTTYTNENPADHVVFNSITNNAAIGDERNFVRVREIGTNNKYSDEVKVTPGKEYEVYIAYHNNAASNLNASGKGIANGVNVASAYPTVVKKGERAMISGIISTTDGDPKDVWDEAYFTTDESEVTVRYKVGTAILHNAGKVNGSVLSTNLFTETGTPIGINTLDGRIPGCAEYSGYITYTLVAEKTSTDLNKQVSLDGENWYEQVKAKPGQTVTYKVTFNNTGNTTLANTIFKDAHDDDLTLVAGTTKVFDVNNVSGKTIAEVLDGSGYNTGDVASGALIQIIYQAQVSEDKSVCNKTLNNKIMLRYNSEDHGEDDASVVVECDEDRKKPGFEIDKKVSIDGAAWLDNIKIKPGDTLTFSISYKNTGNVINHDVRFYDTLDSANGMEYIEGSIEGTRSVEGSVEAGGAIMVMEFPDGQSLFGEDGIYIGDVRAGETITVSYKVKFTADYKKCEITKLYNNARVTGKVDGSSDATTVHDSVEVQIDRTDENCDTPKPDCTLTPDAPECNLPNTGPVEIAMAIAIALGIGGGGYYFYRTKKSLKTIEGAASGKDATVAGDKPAEPKADKK